MGQNAVRISMPRISKNRSARLLSVLASGKAAQMCAKCAELQKSYDRAKAKLDREQRELARYSPEFDEKRFLAAWMNCELMLKRLQRLREDLTTHAKTHANETRAVDG
jgi:hypothetical protein